MRRIIFSLALFTLSAYCATSEHLHGVELYQQKNYLEAISVLESASKTEPSGSAEFRESALLIGQSYFNLSQAPKAIPWLEKVGPLNEANYMLGYAYFLDHKRAQSEAAFARLFQLKPDSAEGHLIAGEMLLKSEYREEAAEEIDTALQMNPKLPEAHFLIGELELHNSHIDKSIEEMKKEIALNPSFSMAWYRLGDAYSREDKWDEAVPNLERSIWLNRTFSGPYILLGKCYFKQKNYLNAESTLKRALALDPGNYSGTYVLAQTLMAEDKKDEARPLLEKLKTMPHDR